MKSNMDAADRSKLELLTEALRVPSATIMRDRWRGEGRKGDLAIRGKFGHGGGFLLCAVAQDERDQSPRRWSSIKRRLAFCALTQDGDDEGCLYLDRIPTAQEAEAIREALGIRRRRHLSNDARSQMAAVQ